MNILPNNFMEPTQLKFATILESCILYTSPRLNRMVFLKHNLYANLMVPLGPLDIIIVVHFQHRFYSCLLLSQVLKQNLTFLCSQAFISEPHLSSPFMESMNSSILSWNVNPTS